MKKFFKLLVAFIMLLTISIGLASCGVSSIQMWRVTFNTGGGSKVESQQIPDGGKVEYPVDPEKDGYTFVEWLYNGEPWDFDAEVHQSMRLDAKWTEGGAPGFYKVNYYLENLYDDGYSLDHSVTRTGKINTQTQAEAINYQGFTAKDFSQKTIEPAGATVIDIYYDRVVANITFRGDGYITSDFSDLSGSYKYGTEIILPTNVSTVDGYEFAGWYDGNIRITTYIVPSYSTVVTAKSKEIGGEDPSVDYASYYVKYYKEDLYEDTYNLFYDDVQRAPVGSTTKIVAEPIEGFVALPITQQVVSEETMVTVNVYYNRKRVSVTVIGDDHVTVPEKYTGTYKYGRVLFLYDHDVEEGYDYQGLFIGDTKLESSVYTVPSEDVVIIAKSKPALTYYTINYHTQYLENDEYDCVSGNGYGETGSLTNVSAEPRTGFEILPIVQKKILGDHSTVVDVYYKRLTPKVTFTVNSNIASSYEDLTKEYKYGTKITLPTPTVKEGCIFDGWYVGSTKIIGTTYCVQEEDVTLEAIAVLDSIVKYTVNTYIENLSDDKYSLDTSTVLKGNVDSITNVVAEDKTGFTAQPIEQKTILQDGSTVVNVYYKRVIVTVSFKENSLILDDFSYLNKGYKYGTVIQLPIPTVDEEHYFKGWNLVGYNGYLEDTYTVGEEDAIIQGIVFDKAKVVYYVYHYKENTTDDEYTVSAIENNYGVPGTATKCEVRDYTGFVAQSFGEKIIAEDGSTIVNIYYKRLTAYITFLQDDSVQTDYSSLTGTYKYGTTITLPTVTVKDGYLFDGWYIGSERLYKYYRVTDEEVVIIATAHAANVMYTINYYYDQLVSENYFLKDQSYQYALTDTITNVKAEPKTGFIAQPIEQKTILGDGSTVIDVYYDRIVSTVTITTDSNILTDYSSKTGKYKYESTILLSTPQVKDGYTFVGWFVGTTQLEDMRYQVGDSDVEIIGRAATNKDIRYVVQYYLENVNNDEYTLSTSKVFYGETDTTTNVEADPKTGFTAQPIEQKTILGDGSTIVEVYYKRVTPKVTFTEDSNITSNHSSLTGTYKYGTTITLPTPEAESGYVFDSWYAGSTKITATTYTVTEDAITLVAKAVENPHQAYIVEIYLENIKNDEYTLDSTTTKYGTYKTTTNVIAEPKAGFIAQEIQQKIILADDTTVVKIYYNRVTPKVTFIVESNITSSYEDLTKEYKYGTTITLPTPKAAAGYVFDGWYVDSTRITATTYTVPKEAVTLVAKAVENPYQAYTVEIYLENLKDSEYTLNSSTTKYGTFNTETRVEAATKTGYTAQPIEQKTILADDSTVVKIYYKRVIVTVTFIGDSSITSDYSSLTGEYKYGATITLPTPTVSAGYEFKGWRLENTNTYLDNTYIVGANDETIEAVVYEKTTVLYYVYHYTENLNNDEYELSAKVDMYGTPGTKTESKVRDYTGFVAQSFSEETIAKDESTIVNIYYKRLTAKITFVVDSHITSSYEDLTKEYKYGTRITLPTPKTKAGYVFDGWYLDSNKINNYYEVTDEEVTLVAISRVINSDYTIKTYLENLEDDTYFSWSTYTSSGLTDTTTEYVAGEIKGFKAEPIEQKTILGDESTVIEVYYKRIVSTVTVTTDSNILTDYSSLTGKYKYGATVKLSNPAVKEGYTFAGWFIDSIELESIYYTVGVSDVEIIGKAITDKDIKYTVNTYLENLDDDNYALSTSKVFYGETDATTTVEAEPKTGFIAQAIEQKTILGDGSTIVSVYYKRIVSTVTVTTDSNVLTDYSSLTGKYKYGATVKLSTPTVKTGYIFAGWFIDSIELESIYYTVGVSDVEIVGKAITDKDIKYTVNTYLENLDDDNYALSTSKVFYGETDATTTVEAESMTGFIAQAIEQKTILGDGSTIVSVYYKRVIVTVTFTVDSNITSNYNDLTGTYKYGTEITLPTPACASKYILDGWYAGSSKINTATYTVTEKNVTLEAKSMLDPHVTYTVEYYVENVDNDEYTFDLKDTQKGIIGETTAFTAEPKTGFTAQEIEQKTILADGSTIIQVYYKRVTPTITFTVDANITSDYSSLTKEYKYGTEITLPTPEVADGYVFDGWYVDSTKITDTTYTVTEDAVTLAAKTIANPHQAYTVITYLENVEDDEYTFDSSKTEYGTFNTTTTVEAEPKTGFTAQEIEQKTILADGSTVVRVYYKRVVSTLTVSFSIKNAGAIASINGSYKYEAVITLPDVSAYLGYLFDGWYIGEDKITESTITMGAEEITLIAQFALLDAVKYFTLNSTETTCEIKGVLDEYKENTTFTIPSYVTSIADYAFKDCTGLTSMTIPNTVLSIGFGAFKGCSSLESMTLPYVGASIDDTKTSCLGHIFGTNNGFYHNSYVPASLKQVVVTDAITIGNLAFYECSNITSVVIPDTVESIGYEAFEGCGSLQSLTVPFLGTSKDNTEKNYLGYFFGSFNAISGASKLPASFTTLVVTNAHNVAADAFHNCSKIESITLMGTYTELGATAFYNCSSLSSLTISSTVTTIDPSAFSNCSIKNFTIDTTYTKWCENSFAYNASHPLKIAESLWLKNEDGTLFDLKALEVVSIPSGITSIPSYAFGNLTNAKSIIIPETVTSIANSAFSGCTGLTSVVIPSSVTSFGSSIFAGCTAIESITMAFVGDNTYLGYLFGAENVSWNDDVVPSSLKKVVITNTTTISGRAFYNCYNVTSIVLSEGVETIGNNAFENCSGLSDFTFPKSLTTIESNAFENCTGLKNIVIPSNVTAIGSGAFSGVEMTSITIPFVGTSKTAGDRFSLILGSFPTSLKTVIVTTTDTIPDKAFENCTGLTSIILPSSITSIGTYAFYNCEGLTSITIPAGVTSIGTYAFMYCDGLTSITLPSSITAIGESAFEECSKITEFTYNGTLANWFEIEFGNEYSHPMAYTTKAYFKNTSGTKYDIKASSTVTIPSTVETISAYSLAYFTNITTLTIPSTVTSIGKAALKGTTLTSLTVPYTGESLNSTISKEMAYIFSGTTTGIPKTLTSITVTNESIVAKDAFYYCPATEITYTNKVTSIGANAFTYSSIKTFELTTSLKSIGNYAFSSSSLESIVIPSSITSLSKGVFYNCSKLTSVTIPTSVTYFSESIFTDCTYTTVVYDGTIGDWCSLNYASSTANFIGSVAGITIKNSDNTTFDLKKVTTLTIPSGVTKINSYAFVSLIPVLRKVEIADTVTSIGFGAFLGCNEIRSMVLPFVGEKLNGTTNTHVGYIFGAETAADQKTSFALKCVLIEITKQTSIPSNAFLNLKYVEKLVLNTTITSISSTAFTGCEKLEIYYKGVYSTSAAAKFSSCGITAYYYSSTKSSNRWHYDDDGNIVFW